MDFCEFKLTYHSPSFLPPVGGARADAAIAPLLDQVGAVRPSVRAAHAAVGRHRSRGGRAEREGTSDRYADAHRCSLHFTFFDVVLDPMGARREIREVWARSEARAGAVGMVGGAGGDAWLSIQVFWIFPFICFVGWIGYFTHPLWGTLIHGTHYTYMTDGALSSVFP